jgi:hypothetical protein
MIQPGVQSDLPDGRRRLKSLACFFQDSAFRIQLLHQKETLSDEPWILNPVFLDTGWF